MSGRIEFFFDFGSPYAYFSLCRLRAIAAAHGRDIVYRPILLWVARKAFDMTPPMEDGAKAGYMLDDMKRSAAFHGVRFAIPDSFGRSTHLAARLFYGLERMDPSLSAPCTEAVFEALFARNEDIGDAGVLAAIVQGLGADPEMVAELAGSQASRDALAQANDRAVEVKVWGSPYFILDGEGFFGADRLPQLEWRLGQATKRDAPADA